MLFAKIFLPAGTGEQIGWFFCIDQSGHLSPQRTLRNADSLQTSMVFPNLIAPHHRSRCSSGLHHLLESQFHNIYNTYDERKKPSALESAKQSLYLRCYKKTCNIITALQPSQCLFQPDASLLAIDSLSSFSIPSLSSPDPTNL
jgi:hypothetical protein